MQVRRRLPKASEFRRPRDSGQPSAPRHWGVDYRHELSDTLMAAWADRYVITIRLLFATLAPAACRVRI
jgi:hypothetical protein